MFHSSSVEAFKKIQKILKYGLDVPLPESETEEEYMLFVCKALNEKNTYNCHCEKNLLFVESEKLDPILSVSLESGVLEFLTYDDLEYFEPFADVIDIITKKYLGKTDLKTKTIKEEDFDWI